MVNGKNKGDAFERSVCRAISQWLVPGNWSTCGIERLPFRRRFTSSTSLEGHWVSGGDLLHWPSVSCPYSFECKKQEGWDLDGMLTAPKWEPWKWWAQCQAQAATVNRVPLLIFSRNRRPVYVLMAEEIAVCLEIPTLHGPSLRVCRPDGERVALVRLDDLVCVSRSRALRLSTANAGSASRRSRTTRRPPRVASAARRTPPARKRAAS